MALAWLLDHWRAALKEAQDADQSIARLAPDHRKILWLSEWWRL